MRTLVFILALTYVWNGWIYESEKPLIVLDGKMVDKETKKEVKPVRQESVCKNCIAPK